VFDPPPPITSLIPGILIDTFVTSTIISFAGEVPPVKSFPDNVIKSPIL
jgi:hypothetical protein